MRTILILLIATTCFCCSTTGRPPSFSNDEFIERAFPCLAAYGKKVETQKMEYLKASDNVRLAYFLYIKNIARPSVLILHGGGAHSRAGYQFLAEDLNNNSGINVYLMDLRGHGKSEGRRGDTPSVERMYEDIEEMVNHITSKTGQAPYLAGHSSACGLILNAIASPLEINIKGYIFLSPEFGYKSETARENRVEFAEIKLSVFLLAAITDGKIGGNCHAVFLNYPPEILLWDTLLINKLTRNMAVAQTPDRPKEQFAAIDKRFALLIGEHDELLDPEKVMAYYSYPAREVKDESTCLVLKNAKHLSAIWLAGEKIAKIIEKWELK